MYELSVSFGLKQLHLQEWNTQTIGSGEHRQNHDIYSVSCKMGYQSSFPRVQWLEHGVDHPPQSSTKM